MKRVMGGTDCSSAICPQGQYCINDPNMGAMCIQGPGGDNGDPCPTLCEPLGGTIFCIGNKNGVGYVLLGNCSTHDWELVRGFHNRCDNDATGSFWC